MLPAPLLVAPLLLALLTADPSAPRVDAGRGKEARRIDITRCPEWRDVYGALGSVSALFGTATSMKMTQELREGPKVDPEGVDRILQLTKESFAVFEDGLPQVVDGFEVVRDLPLSLAIGIDTSGSMEESLPDAQWAASGFLKAVATPRDRALLVSFDNEPRLVTHFTTDRDRLVQGIASLRAQGSTTLWDAIVYGLFQFQGARGRKAFVVLIDGDDRSSRFEFDAMFDYAKKSGIPVYFIGLRIGSSHFDIRAKLNKLARETGGTTFYVESARVLDGIYKQFEDELRSQYLLAYVPKRAPSARPDRWRKVEVKMTPSSLSARTISGYYP